MKIILLLFVALQCNYFLYAQETGILLKGRVFTADGEPAASVLASVKETKQTTLTAADGSFSFKMFPGKYSLKIKSLGETKEVETELIANRDTIIKINLNAYAYELNEVVVTGAFEPQSAKNSVYSVHTINQERIQLRAATNLVQVLNTELGVRFSNDLTLGTSDISLMGMSGQGVKILLDGVPVIDRGATRESLGQIDINTVDRIEIVEGPMSVMYGTDALAGVINIITKKGFGAEKFSVTAKVQEESAGKEYSGFGNKGLHNQNLTIDWQHNGWSVSGAVSQNNFGGWQGNSIGRALDWYPKNQILVNPRIGYSSQNLKVWYSSNFASENISSYGIPNANTNIATDKDYISRRFFNQAQAELTVSSKLSFTGSLAYTDYSRRTQTTNLNILNGDRRLSLEQGTQDTSSFNSEFLRLTAQYKLSDKFSFQPGIEVNLTGSNGARISGSPQINDYAFFLSSEIKVMQRINIRPGFRLIKNSVYNAPPVIPSVNSLFKLNKNFDLRLAYARGFRSPALRELYFNFFDASHSILGNTNLKAEYSNSYNGSLTWRINPLSVFNYEIIASGFYNVFENLIDIGVNPEQAGVNTYINVDKFKTTGTSVQANVRWKNLKANTGFFYIGRYNSFYGDGQNGNLPQFVWSPELSNTLIYTFPKAGTSLSFNYKLNGKKPSYEAREEAGKTTVKLAETSAFQLADFSFNKNVNHFMSLTGGVKNLFNVTRINNTSGDTGNAHSTAGPVPVSYGRSFFLGLTMQWSKNLSKNK